MSKSHWSVLRLPNACCHLDCCLFMCSCLKCYFLNSCLFMFKMLFPKLPAMLGPQDEIIPHPGVRYTDTYAFADHWAWKCYSRIRHHFSSTSLQSFDWREPCAVICEIWLTRSGCNSCFDRHVRFPWRVAGEQACADGGKVLKLMQGNKLLQSP